MTHVDQSAAGVTSPQNARISTGIPGLDGVLGGGLMPSRLYLLEGSPGAGKTTLALQFLMEGRSRGERGLFVTLSETTEELEAIAVSHGWSLDGIDFFELSSAKTCQIPSEKRHCCIRGRWSLARPSS